MDDLRKTRVIVYSAVAGEVAIADIELPALALGTTFFYGENILCVEGFAYDIEEQIHGIICGMFVGAELGELEGSTLHYPYGHIPSEIFKSWFNTPHWEVKSDTEIGCLASRPIKVCKLPEFNECIFTVALH